MSTEKVRLLGNYPDASIRERFASELKPKVQGRTGEPLSLHRAFDMARVWEFAVEKTWTSFVTRKLVGLGPLHARICGSPRQFGPGTANGPEDLDDTTVFEFQRLMQLNSKERISLQDARKTGWDVIEYLRWLYRM